MGEQSSDDEPPFRDEKAQPREQFRLRHAAERRQPLVVDGVDPYNTHGSIVLAALNSALGTNFVTNGSFSVTKCLMSGSDTVASGDERGLT
jgi:hypothetical protein